MKKILLFLFVLVSFVASAQTPPGYTKISARYDWLAGKFDSGLHVPGYATTPNIRSGVWVGSGNIGIDTILHKFFFYSGGTWRSVGSGGYNSNIGSGFRWAVPNTNNIKTVFSSNTIIWDSSSNANGLTPKADTSVLATQYDLTQISGATPTLQAVTDVGSVTTTSITSRSQFQSFPSYTSDYVSQLVFTGNGVDAEGALVLREWGGGGDKIVTLSPATDIGASDITLRLYGNDGDTLATLADVRAGGGAPILPSTQIPFGNGTDPYTSSADFVYDVATPLFKVAFAGNDYININLGAGNFRFGDASFAGNASRLEIDDAAYILLQSKFDISIGDPDVSVNGTYLKQSDATQTLTYQKGSDVYLSLDIATGVYRIGDLGDVTNGIKAIFDDGNEQITLKGGSNQYLFLDIANNRYQLGDISNAINGIYADVDDGAQTFTLHKNADIWFSTDIANATGKWGEPNAGGNQTFFSWDGNLQQIVVNGKDAIIGDFSAIGNNIYLDVTDSGEAIYFQKGGNIYFSTIIATGTETGFWGNPGGNATSIAWADAAQTITSTAAVDFIVTSPQVSLYHVKGLSATPGIAAGAGAGTTPTISLTGTDLSGFISVTTGTLPTLSAIVATITFATAYGAAPIVVITPANTTTAALSGLGSVYVAQAGTTTTTFDITAGATALTAATTYLWYYTVSQ